MGNIMKVMGNPNNIPFLPYEIIFNILKRLPVKFLIQFQCVCKDWKNLINSPSFIRDHLSHTSHRPTALLSHKPTLKSSFRFQLLDRRSMQVLEIQKPPLMDSFISVRIGGSCNGLVCLQVTNKINWARYILLWNPATRQFKKIPGIRSTIRDFAVDYILRFGFTPMDNDYKIVIIMSYFAVNPVKVKVYSLNSGSWKEVEFENLEGTISINSFGNVILNGVVYGFGSSVQHDYYDMVVSIDVTKHVCTSIPLPDLGSVKSRRIKLLFYENKPVVVAVTISLVHLWVMEEDTCASRGRWIWTKKYTCSFCAMSFCGMVRLSPFEFFPITIWKNEIVFRRVFSQLGGKRRFCLLNLTTSEFKNFFLKCSSLSDKSDFNYVESLVSVGNINNKEP